jgi:hypothetical protein
LELKRRYFGRSTCAERLRSAASLRIMDVEKQREIDAQELGIPVERVVYLCRSQAKRADIDYRIHRIRNCYKAIVAVDLDQVRSNSIKCRFCFGTAELPSPTTNTRRTPLESTPKKDDNDDSFDENELINFLACTVFLFFGERFIKRTPCLTVHFLPL